MSELAEAAARARDLLPAPGWATSRRWRTADADHVEEGEDLEVVLVRDGRVSRGSASGLDGDAARGAVAAAMDDAGEPVDHPGPAPLVRGRAHEGFDPATARAGPRDLPPGVEALTEEIAIASSAGGEVLSDARTCVLARAEDAGGWARGAAVGLGGLDLAALEATARRRAPPQGEAVTRTGEMRAILAPEAVGDLLAHLGATAFSGAHDAGPRLGTRVAAAAVNLSDSPRFPGTLGAAFDSEGTPTSPIPLVQDGVAHRVVHDLRSAARAGAAPTGHARSAGGVPLGPAPRNLVLVGGGVADEAALVAGVEQGVFVTGLGPGGELLGAREIRDGRLAASLRPVRLAEDPLDLLARVEALSARPRLVGAGALGVMAPAIAVSGIMVA